MIVGTNIKARRKKLGMNAETLAEIVGVSPTTIYRYENGAIEKLDSVKLELIAEALETTPAALMGRPDLSEAQRKLQGIAESLPTAKQSRGWQTLSRGFSRAEGEPEEYTMSDIDYALSDEIQDLSETDKQEILDYIRFKRAQKAKKEQQP